MSTEHVNVLWGLLGLYFPWFMWVSRRLWGGGFRHVHMGIKDFHKCWSGSSAKRTLCLGPAGVVNCAPRSALSFWVSLFPRTRGTTLGDGEGQGGLAGCSPRGRKDSDTTEPLNENQGLQPRRQHLTRLRETAPKQQRGAHCTCDFGGGEARAIKDVFLQSFLLVSWSPCWSQEESSPWRILELF